MNKRQIKKLGCEPSTVASVRTTLGTWRNVEFRLRGRKAHVRLLGEKEVLVQVWGPDFSRVFYCTDIGAAMRRLARTSK